MTKRCDGAVGSPNSSALPSAVRPRVTTVKALSAWEWRAGSGSGQMDAQPVVAARVDEGRGDPDHGVVGPQLHVGVDVDPVLAHPRLGGPVHVVGPEVGRR